MHHTSLEHIPFPKGIPLWQWLDFWFILKTPINSSSKPISNILQACVHLTSSGKKGNFGLGFLVVFVHLDCHPYFMWQVLVMWLSYSLPQVFVVLRQMAGDRKSGIMGHCIWIVLSKYSWMLHLVGQHSTIGQICWFPLLAWQCVLFDFGNFTLLHLLWTLEV